MEVEFRDFNLSRTEPPTTKTSMPLADLSAKHAEGDFLRAVAQLIMDFEPQAIDRYCQVAS